MSSFAIDDAAWSNRWRHRSSAEKALLAMGLLAVASTTGRPAVGVAVAVVSLLAATRLAGVPMRTFVLAWSAPLAFVVPALMAVVISVGPAPDAVARLGPLSVTDGALEQAAMLGSRAFGGSGALLLLATTTPFIDVVDGARRLRVPEPILDVAALTYRFVLVLASSAHRTLDAQRARLGYGTGRAARNSVGLLSARVGLRSMDRARRLEEGLAGRGYAGSLRTLAPVARTDRRFMAGALIVLALLQALSWWPR